MEKLRQALELIEQLKAILDTMDLPDYVDEYLEEIEGGLENRLRKQESDKLSTLKIVDK